MTTPKRPMVNPPLPRHAALQPLSREHFGGLVLARDLVRASKDHQTAAQRRTAVHRFAAAWSDELGPHFADEQRLLGRLNTAPELFLRHIAEHRELERLATQAIATGPDDAPDPAWLDPAWLDRAGQLLHDHIRWEERVLFPAIEAEMSEADAAEIARHTADVEAHRPGARRRHDLSKGGPLS